MPTARRRGAAAAPTTILVVEENPEVRELIRLALAGAGREIVVAPSAAAALEEAGTRRIDLLVTEVALSGLPGPEIARRLRAKHPALRVLYVSGWYDHAGFPDLGDESLLQKPFSIKTLRQAVERVLEGGAGRRSD